MTCLYCVRRARVACIWEYIYWYYNTNVTRDWPTIARQIINAASYKRNIMHKIGLFMVKQHGFLGYGITTILIKHNQQMNNWFAKYFLNIIKIYVVFERNISKLCPCTLHVRIKVYQSMCWRCHCSNTVVIFMWSIPILYSNVHLLNNLLNVHCI